MAELARIELGQRIASPSCQRVVEGDNLERVLEGEVVRCERCGERIKLPREVVERYQRSKYVGTNLDITC